MSYRCQALRVLSLLLFFALSTVLPAAGFQAARKADAADAPATVGFAKSSTIIPEGTGRLDIQLMVEAGAGLPAEARISIAGASTAIEGVDYTIAGRSLGIGLNASSPPSISLEILDNALPGSRYLILELELPDGSPLALGKKKRHIVLIQDTDNGPPTAQEAPRAKLSHLASFALPKGSSAEILAYDPGSSRIFVVNSAENKLEILDFSNPSDIKSVKRVHLDVFGSRVNSVATRNGLVAVAIQHIVPTEPGRVVFLDADGFFINCATVGAMPDMLLFSPDGSKVLTANEGEPNDDYTIDPEGSISIIDISGGAAHPKTATLGFSAFNSRQAELIAGGVRIFGPGASVAQDLEPEHIAISDDGRTAYITCQENNALALLDLAVPEITAIWPLGYKDWAAEGLSLDASNASGGIFFANWPVRGMYQPDAIDYVRVGGKAYLITANEGDERDYKGFSEEFRVGDKKIVLDEGCFPGAEYLKEDVLLGRLRISNASGDTNADGRYEALYAFGARSFAIWDAATGALVYDSGNDLEQITAADPVFGRIFNTQKDKNDFKSRSDDKGPEPAGVVVAEINGIPYAFIGLERIGGLVMYELSNPKAPQFVQYINTRSIDSLGGDLSPEGLAYVAPEDSPTGLPYILVAFEFSGTVGVFEISTAPTVGFAGKSSVVKKEAGEIQLELVVEQAGKFDGKADIKVISPSTAVEGKDFTMATSTAIFEGGANEPKSIKIGILNNDTQASRYLILEIDPASSTVNIGDNSRHILLIQDNDMASKQE